MSLREFALRLPLLLTLQHLSNLPIVYHILQTRHSKAQQSTPSDRNSYVSNVLPLPLTSVFYAVVLLRASILTAFEVDGDQNFFVLEAELTIFLGETTI